jgi:hypothetical protein
VAAAGADPLVEGVRRAGLLDDQAASTSAQRAAAKPRCPTSGSLMRPEALAEVHRRQNLGANSMAPGSSPSFWSMCVAGQWAPSPGLC